MSTKPLRVLPQDGIELQAKLFRGFGDASRLAILTILLDGPVRVSEIVERTRMTQSNVSNHLACLKDCGLVKSEQDGRFVRYELADKRVAKLIDIAGDLLADVAENIYDCTRYSPQKRARDA